MRSLALSCLVTGVVLTGALTALTFLLVQTVGDRA